MDEWHWERPEESQRWRPEPIADDVEVAVLRNALRRLAANCDHAMERDGRGFGRLDTDAGHRLAAKPYWNNRDVERARKLAHRYRRQLSEAAGAE
jgi:hypothetical protein